MSVNMKTKRLKGILLFLFIITFCFLSFVYAEAGTSKTKKSKHDQEVNDFINQMSLDEKICQLFILTPEALTGSGNVTMAGDRTQAAIYETPVGGLIYMENNLEGWDQTKSMLDNTQQYSYARIGLPMFLAVDEEGGRVRRVSGRIGDISAVPSMGEVGYWESEEAYALGERIGNYLSELGFNVDFAPVADVLSNSDNSVIGDRSFGTNPIKVAELVVSVMDGLQNSGIIATLKHFPGHGSTSEDSHDEYAISYQEMNELMNQDLLPFAEGIAHGAKMIMMGHISLPEITGEMTPSSLSHDIVTDLLRDKLKYDGIIITDALEMGAITEHYNSSDAAIKAIQAGCDMLLMPSDWHAARYALIDAVESGVISEERIDDSVKRIIELKLALRNAHSNSLEGLDEDDSEENFEEDLNEDEDEEESEDENEDDDPAVDMMETEDSESVVELVEVDIESIADLVEDETDSVTDSISDDPDSADIFSGFESGELQLVG